MREEKTRELTLKEKSMPITCAGGKLQLGIPPCPARRRTKFGEDSRNCNGEMHSVWYRDAYGRIEKSFQCSNCTRKFTEKYLEGKGLYPYYGSIIRNPFEHQKSRRRNT